MMTSKECVRPSRAEQINRFEEYKKAAQERTLNR